MRLRINRVGTGRRWAADNVERYKRRLTNPRYSILLITAAVIGGLFYALGCSTDDRGMRELEPVGKMPRVYSLNTVRLPVNFAYGVRSITGCSTAVADSDDGTARLNTWLAAVPDGTVVDFAPSACYRLDRTLFIRGHRNLTLNGNGATFKRIAPTPETLLYPKSNPHFLVEGGSGLTLRNFRIEGLNTVNSADPWTFDPGGFSSGYGDKAFESGIGIRGVSGITITNVEIDAVFGDGITVGSELAETCTSDVTIESVSIDRNGRQGISVVCATHTLIDHAKILHSYATGIDVEPNGADAHVEYLKIQHSYLNARTVAISSAGTYDISDVLVLDNALAGWDPAYPWLCVCGPTSSHRHDWSVQNNRTLRGADDRSTVEFLNVANVSFVANVSISSGNRPVASIKLGNVTGAIRIQNNSLPGAPATYSSDATIGSILACGNQLSGQQGALPC